MTAQIVHHAWNHHRLKLEGHARIDHAYLRCPDQGCDVVFSVGCAPSREQVDAAFDKGALTRLLHRAIEEAGP